MRSEIGIIDFGELNCKTCNTDGNTRRHAEPVTYERSHVGNVLSLLNNVYLLLNSKAQNVWLHPVHGFWKIKFY